MTKLGHETRLRRRVPVQTSELETDSPHARLDSEEVETKTEAK